MPEIEDDDDREDDSFPCEHDAQHQEELDGCVEVDYELSHEEALVVASLHTFDHHSCAVVKGCTLHQYWRNV